jgi:hypothetical protein
LLCTGSQCDTTDTSDTSDTNFIGSTRVNQSEYATLEEKRHEN